MLTARIAADLARQARERGPLPYTESGLEALIFDWECALTGAVLCEQYRHELLTPFSPSCEAQRALCQHFTNRGFTAIPASFDTDSGKRLKVILLWTPE